MLRIVVAATFVIACLGLVSADSARAAQWDKPFDARQWVGKWQCKRNADMRQMVLVPAPRNRVTGSWETKTKPRRIMQRKRHFFPTPDDNQGNILRIVAFKGDDAIRHDADRQEITLYMHRGKDANGRKHVHASGVSRWRSKGGKIIASPVDCHKR